MSDPTGPSTPPVSEDVLIIVPVRNLVLFPGVVSPLSLSRDVSIAAVKEAVRTERKIGLLLQHDADVSEPTPADLYQVGTVASVLRYATAADGGHHLVVQGEQRFRVIDFQPGMPFMLARVEYAGPAASSDTDLEARVLHLKRLALEAAALLPQAPPELASAVKSMESAEALADLVANFLDVKSSEKQMLLETVDLRTRLERVATLLAHRVEVLKLTRRLQEQTRESIDERQREMLLREQLKTIQRELGDGDGAEQDLADLSEAIDAAGLPPEVHEQVAKDLKRLRRMPQEGGEHSMLRTYLETVAALPWSTLDAEAIDIDAARGILAADHYGLDKVKKRILEFLAVRKLNPTGKSPILCLVGPPGVGKTSLGQSIARAMGRKFARLSLGGVHDEAEIRGHRRTYIGALPGLVLQALKKAGSRNPVLMLDEVDKVGRGFQGDPFAALLEVLDPEQNGTFRDNYLGLPFDLSQVLFIATANMLDTVPGPLRDRMEIIELSGYTEDEKVEIASRYLVDRQRRANGLTDEQAVVTIDALRLVVRGYTREAGCRSLEREIGALLRNAAVKIACGALRSVTIDAAEAAAILGAPRYDNEVAMRAGVPGVATGLAWTPVGGDILFIESARTPGSGKLTLTGQLGDVMKESAQAAVSLVKANAISLGIDPALFEHSDLHVHVPAGATPKDGPSAGTAIYLSLVSLLTKRVIRPDVAVTGEISLRGLVLPVGGIKEKTIAAARAGIRTVYLPARNRRDLAEIPDSVRAAVSIEFVDRVELLTDAVFDARAETPALASA